MNTFRLSRSSSTNTTLLDPDGVISYTISTPLRLGPSQTTIRRGDSVVVIASIKWGWLNSKSTITMHGQTTLVGEWFPRSNMLSTSRIYTNASGEKIKWRGTQVLSCMGEDTGLHLVTYDRVPYHPFRRWQSSLNISSNGMAMLDELVVTWVIAEKKARDRRRAGR
ncbi:unnamed protein product [Rhizoctonia solani]|uniref:DUF6593 domain-containing protein n=1 Tax=Rhizoctonia solani TaxID=456999 RepID=A0A8H3CTS8_9AGAM|nr:unnamed protein product [Rhizoctonia solani]